ncbi:MAG: SusE domain-containing protein [Bacteroidetes bacterium]|nr:SusE domain-containing protein [Bacteroidota bacterium]
MKKITLMIFSMVLMLLLISCESDIDKVVISADPAEPALSQLTFTGDFAITNANGPITFSWTEADFGFTSSTTYAVEVSPVSDFSSNVATLFTTQLLTGSAKVADMNALLLTWEAELGTDFTVYYRVAAKVTDDNMVYSSVNSVVFVPYETLIDYPMAYVPGAYQGWSPGADNGRLYSYGFNSLYEGILRIVDGTNAESEFKVTVNPNWDGPNYGGTLTKTGNNYSGSLDSSGDNFKVAAGTYSFAVNVSALTISLTKTNDWGIIGSATANGWDSDQNMQYNGQRKVWEITTDLVAGEFKFRANDGWDLNYGDTGADGTLEAGGDNIAITAGNYTIRFDPVALTYVVIAN